MCNLSQLTSQVMFYADQEYCSGQGKKCLTGFICVTKYQTNKTCKSSLSPVTDLPARSCLMLTKYTAVVRVRVRSVLQDLFVSQNIRHMKPVRVYSPQ